VSLPRADGHVIKVLIADDHPVVREGLRLVLERRSDIRVVSDAVDGRDAVEAAIRLRPDVVIVDLDMPKLDGVHVIIELKRALPDARCLVLTMHDDDAHLFDALAAGAVGYLVKGARSEDIERAVRAAAAGQVVLAPEVAMRVTKAVASGRPRKGGDAFADLSDRELTLLDLLAGGCDNFAIARAIGVTPKTVRNQVSSLIDKLGVRDRSEAGKMGRDAGLGTAANDYRCR